MNARSWEWMGVYRKHTFACNCANTYVCMRKYLHVKRKPWSARFSIAQRYICICIFVFKDTHFWLGEETSVSTACLIGPGGFPAGIRANTRDWAMIQERLTLNLTADHIVKHNVKHIEHWSALKMQTMINIVKKGTGYPFLAFSIITQNQEKWNWLVHTVKKEAAIVCIRRVQYKSNMYPNYPQFGHILHIKTTYGLMTMLYETELVGIL